MTHIHHSLRAPKLPRVHLGLDEDAETFLDAKAEHVFRREPRILRLRIEVEPDPRGRGGKSTAKGCVEAAVRSLTASVATDAPAASVTVLADKLDCRMRKRKTRLIHRRAADDTETHLILASSI